MGVCIIFYNFCGKNNRVMVHNHILEIWLIQQSILGHVFVLIISELTRMVKLKLLPLIEMLITMSLCNSCVQCGSLCSSAATPIARWDNKLET